MNRIWCGYYDGNEKSRRVQEKLGFVYQRKTEGIEVSLLGEIRTGHVMLMTRKQWEMIRIFDWHDARSKEIEKEAKANGTWCYYGLDSNQHLFKPLYKEAVEEIKKLREKKSEQK